MYTAKYDELDKWIKVIIQLFLGGWVSPIYRILRYIENKNTTTLIVAILCFLCVGPVFAIIDLVTLIMNNKISVLAD